jgi:hypothetical protein
VPYRLERRARAILERLARVADENEAGDALPGLA